MYVCMYVRLYAFVTEREMVKEEGIGSVGIFLLWKRSFGNYQRKKRRRAKMNGLDGIMDERHIKETKKNTRNIAAMIKR